MSYPASARPASTVVLLRDAGAGPETLLLRRNKALLFAGGYWVFPGGALEPADIEAGGGDDEAAARVAAAREALEEAGMRPDPDSMVQLSHWTTPVAEKKRFATWFFAAPVGAGAEVVIDGDEIHDARWIGVSEAIRCHEGGELAMLPPTYVTLRRLARYSSIATLIAGERARLSPAVSPVFVKDSDRPCVLFRGDAGYEAGHADSPGARHRAVLDGGCWRYRYQGVDPAFPRLVED